MAVEDHGLEAIRKSANEVTAGDKSDYYLNTRGAVSTTGLSTSQVVTEVTLNSSTWTALPATALANRNAIAIQNPSGQEIKINSDSGESGYVGMVIAAGGERQYDITDDIVLYGKSKAGSPTVNVEELS